MGRIIGFGAERIELPATATPEEIAERRLVMLSRCLNMKTTVAVVGAGCSRALGYPDWNEFTSGVIASVLTAIATCDSAEYRSAAARLTQLSTRTNRAFDELLVTLGFCQRISRDLEQHGYGNPYLAFIERTFGNPNRVEPSWDPGLNPYVALLHLPIRRFITSNYDVELEHAITRDDPSLRPRYGLGKGEPKERWLSFTQSDAFVAQQSAFAFSREQPYTVFHCHGRYDDADSMVVTEDDYQRWYLRNDVAGQAFRQNLEVLFGSNPILFVGFSMHDDDLLYAMRLLNAGDPTRQRPRARSLFALLPSSDDEAADRNRDDLLYTRYNVHVVTYDAAAPNEMGPALCRKLLALRDRSLDIREDFIRKPVIRKVTVAVNPPQPYLHYAIARDGDDDLAPARTQQDLDRLRDLVAKNTIVAIHGYGGSGKSWRAMDLIDEIRSNRGISGIDGVFFWSSYYADDWLTGFDRMLAYFRSQPAPRLTRVMRVAECLKGRHLLVFDGFERLLRDHGSQSERASAVHAIEELLDAMRGGNSTVVLTMRVMPDMLKGKPGVAEFAMRRAATAELAKGRVFGPMVRPGLLSYDDLAAVCSLCDGHSYALALAAAYLRAEGDAGMQRRMQHFRRRLSDASPAHRLTTMIDLAIKDLTARAGGRAQSLLGNIAIFMSPVTQAMVEVCAGGAACENDLKALLEARLLFKVSADPESADVPSGYTVHPMVRNYIFGSESPGDLESIPNFTLSGFTSGATPVHPGSRHCAETIKQLFDLLHAEAERALELGDVDRARQLCRGAFSAVRSRMEANSVTRWTTYDRYLDRFQIPLANLVKRVAPAMWDYMDRSHAPSREQTDGPLFADELAWLWNDIGLAFYEQGAMVDAHAVWELSYEIDRVTDSYEDGGQYLVQSRLQMTAAFIDMGRLDTAGEYLTNTEESNRSYGDAEFAGRILGYKALLTHLRGNVEEADHLYDETDAQLRKIGRNLRGRSIFAKHHADLKITIGELGPAEGLIRTSMALAEEGKHLDLIAYARASSGHLQRVRGNLREAQLEYDASLAAAKAMGMRRLECGILCELARLALSLGDWQTARARAVASLMIANESWLGLQRSSALVVLGNAMIEARDPRLGAAYLRHAYAMAAKQGYLLRAHEAETRLRSIGEPVDEMEVRG